MFEPTVRDLDYADLGSYVRIFPHNPLNDGYDGFLALVPWENDRGTQCGFVWSVNGQPLDPYDGVEFA